MKINGNKMAHFHWENACYLSWQKSPKGAHLHMHLETTTLFIALTEVNWWQSVETVMVLI